MDTVIYYFMNSTRLVIFAGVDPGKFGLKKFDWKIWRTFSNIVYKLNESGMGFQVMKEKEESF